MIKNLWNLMDRYDARVETAWRDRNWSEFGKHWVLGTIGITVLCFFLILIPGFIYAELARLFLLFKTGGGNTVGLHSSVLSFAAAFAAVAAVIAFTSCPLIMYSIGHLRTESESPHKP